MGPAGASSRLHYRKSSTTSGLVAFSSRVHPIEEISKLQMFSSRPARRKSGAKDLFSLRAIPWVFGLDPERFLLPSWFGGGGGPQGNFDSDPGQLRVCWAALPALAVFRMLILKVEMTLSKVDWILAHSLR